MCKLSYPLPIGKYGKKAGPILSDSPNFFMLIKKSKYIPGFILYFYRKELHGIVFFNNHMIIYNFTLPGKSNRIISVLF